MLTLVDGEKCLWCVARACAGVCAVDALYTDGVRTFVNPFDCTDDHACIPECPAMAIDEVDPDHLGLARVREMFERHPERFHQLSSVSSRKPLPADRHENIRALLLHELSPAASATAGELRIPELERFLPMHPGDGLVETDPSFSNWLAQLVESCFPDRVQEITENIRSLRTGRG